MNIEELLDYDDLGDALREDRALRPAREYRFLLAQGDLNFQSRHVSDPVPLGSQLLEAAALRPRDGYSLFAILSTGEFEDVRLDEPFDLRGRGAERFIAFLTDRDFKLTLNGEELRWGRRRGPFDRAR
jgi:Multiubiquitin